MRIKVTASSALRCGEVARRLRGMLRLEDFVVTDSRPDYQVEIAASGSQYIEVDGVDCELERQIVNMIAELTETNILLKRAGGVQSDRAIRIGLPSRETDCTAVENGVFRGLVKHTKRSQRPGLWQRILGFFVLIVFCSIGVSAQVTPTGTAAQKVDITKVGGTTVTTSLPVTCIAGCTGEGGGGASTIADGADVNAGATTDAAVSGDANGTLSAKIRQLNRIFTLVWDNVNNRINVNIGNSSLAVSQSGTWTINAITNPVSVTGTFWQATQPVSGPLTDTQLRASAVPVAGTFWQATQPISAAALPLPSGAATSAKQDTTNASLSSIDSKITAVNTGAVVVSSSALPAGASTAAKQPALGTAGSASSDVITVQGITAMTALKVDGSGVTQPVSGTVIANAGTGTMAVSAASLPLPSLAATSTKQSDGSQKTQVVDGSGNIIGATSNALDINIKSGNPTSITANAGANLNTSALALESGGNLATIASKDFATAAKQDTGNTSLATIAGKDFSTSAKQDTANSYLSSLDAKTPSLINNAQPVVMVTVPMVMTPPLLSQAQMSNPLLYRAAMKNYCALVLCPALPLGK